MELTAERKVALIGIVIITSLFAFNSILVPKYATESENVRFNQWVTYFSNCESYTVEYKNFEDFKIESDASIPMSASKMASDIKDVRDDTGFVTVYYDWENDVIFYGGSGPDSNLQYCYYFLF